MAKTLLPLFLVAVLPLTLACNESTPRSGDEVTIEMPDGTLVTGRVADPSITATPPADGPATGALAVDGEPTVVASPAPPADPTQPAPPAPETDVEPTIAAPMLREVRVPAGTTLRLELDTALASDMNRVEDSVRARVRTEVVVDGITVIPDGSVVHGTVTSAEPSGKVSGRARLAFRFDEIEINHDRYEVRSETVFYEAKSTRREDAKKIGIGAGAGAVIGGLLGGGKGAGTGAAIGGGAGTAMVLTTTGQEVELRPGTTVEVALARELVVLAPNS